MKPEARAEMVAHAERALRRGELIEAVSLYESLCQSFPEDSTLALRLTHVREMLQPEELQMLRTSRANTQVEEPEPVPQGPSTPVAEGERLFALGDYVGAAAAYRRALQAQPHNELIRERLVEVYRLASHQARLTLCTTRRRLLESNPDVAVMAAVPTLTTAS
jgi:tetratricopeptide (TPR) repeat protein